MSKLAWNLNNIGGRLFGPGFYRTAIRTRLLLSSKHEPVIIWQMGKVGSSSILNSLHQSSLDAAIFHVHVLSDKLISKGGVINKSTP